MVVSVDNRKKSKIIYWMNFSIYFSISVNVGLSSDSILVQLSTRSASALQHSSGLGYNTCTNPVNNWSCVYYQLSCSVPSLAISTMSAVMYSSCGVPPKVITSHTSTPYDLHGIVIVEPIRR